MNLTRTEKTGQPKIRHSLALPETRKKASQASKPKTARLKIINGRPYYYAIENVWDREAKKCRQVQQYLGKELPRGYRLTK